MEQQKNRAPYAIREAALIFESDSVRHLDFVIGVFAPPTLRMHRVLQRDKLTREEVLQRMKNQIDEDIKMKLCDAVIYNDEQHPVIPQVLSLHEQLLQRAAAAP
jgi:dephospho-CoA kinase